MRNWSLLIVLFLFGSVFLNGCEEPRRHRRHLQKKSVKVYHLHDGRYCYHDDFGLWYWLILNNSATSSSGPSYYSGSSVRPSGYSWAPISSGGSRVEPDTKEIQTITETEPASVIEETITCDDRGCPAVDADGNLVDPDALSPDGGYGPDAPDGSDGGMGGGDGGSDGGGSGGDGGGDGGGGGGDGGGGGGDGK